VLKTLRNRRKPAPSGGLLSAITGSHTLVEADARDLLLRLVRSPDTLAEVADGVELHTARGGRCADALERLRVAAGTPQQRAAAALLSARSAEGAGDSTAAESLIREALEGDPEMEPALRDAAQYAAARGDAGAAEAYLRRMRDPETSLRAPLQRLLGPATVGSGRNQPCPCGSGRKLKKCCLRTAVHPLPERAPLLYALLGTYAERAPGMELVRSLSERTDSSLPGTYYFCLDMAIFEGELAERFLREREDWLRPDERELIEGWLATPIRLYEVVEVRRGVGVTVRALPEGEPTYLKDRMFSLSVGRLDLVCGRLLFDGDGPRILGNPVWVSRERRQELLDLLAGEPGMEQLSEFFGPQPDPQLRNHDGHDVYDCRVVYEVPNGEAAWRTLLALPQLIETDEDALGWHERLPDGRVLYKGSMERSRRRLTVSANSRERMAELERMVREAVRDARERSRKAERLGAEPAPGGRQGRVFEVDTILLPTDGDMTGAETAGRMAQVWERGWLDEPRIIGLTPREATTAGGPALIELRARLDDMQWRRRRAAQDGRPVDTLPDPDRLRRELGLAR